MNELAQSIINRGSHIATEYIQLHSGGWIIIPVKLSTIINNIDKIANLNNADAIREFCQFMKNSGAWDKHINNNLKIVWSFAGFSNAKLSFEDIKRQEFIQYSFLAWR